MKQVSIIILNYNLTNEVKNLLKSIETYVKDVDYEVIVVDNNSPDRSIESLVDSFPKYKFVLLDTNYGFGHGNNTGMSLAEGEYFLLLNPDTYLIENLPKKLYEFSKKHPDFGVVGPLLLYENGGFQISAAKYPNIKQEIGFALGILSRILRIVYRIKKIFLSKDYYQVDFVFGSAMFIDRKIYDLIGGFDEDYFLLAEETDWCYRIKKQTDFEIVYWMGAKLIHLKSKITNKVKPERFKWAYESKLIFFNKHYSFLRVLLLRIIIILVLFIKRLMLFFRKKNNENLSYQKVYTYLIRLYIKGIPPKQCKT